jgi:hypothetical protein
MKWIKTTEQLPEHDSSVLIVIRKISDDQECIMFTSIFEIINKKVPVQEGCKRKVLKQEPAFYVWTQEGEFYVIPSGVSHWIYVRDIPKPTLIDLLT